MLVNFLHHVAEEQGIDLGDALVDVTAEQQHNLTADVQKRLHQARTMVQTRLTTALALAFPLLRQVERVERTAAETTTWAVRKICRV